MGFDDVLIFICVVEYYSFIQVVQSLGMQKFMVSWCIVLLEECLGVCLFNCIICKLCLIEVGQVYYECCWQIMYDFVEVEQVVMQLQQVLLGLLWIILLIEFGQMFFVSLLGDFMCQYLQIIVEVELVLCSVDLLQEGVDIVIMVGQLEDFILVVCCLFFISCWFCVSFDYLVVYGMLILVVEFVGYCVVFLFIDFQCYWLFFGDSLFCQWVLFCNNIIFVCEVVVVGVGIVVLLVLICVESVYSGCLVCLLVDVLLLVGELYVVYFLWCFQVMKVKVFFDFLISCLLVDIGCLLELEVVCLIILCF